jgi:hypothetical protein
MPSKTVNCSATVFKTAGAHEWSVGMLAPVEYMSRVAIDQLFRADASAMVQAFSDSERNQVCHVMPVHLSFPVRQRLTYS